MYRQFNSIERNKSYSDVGITLCLTLVNLGDFNQQQYFRGFCTLQTSLTSTISTPLYHTYLLNSVLRSYIYLPIIYCGKSKLHEMYDSYLKQNENYNFLFELQQVEKITFRVFTRNSYLRILRDLRLTQQHQFIGNIYDEDCLCKCT